MKVIPLQSLINKAAGEDEQIEILLPSPKEMLKLLIKGGATTQEIRKALNELEK